MSVGVKTPSKTQFGHCEFPCGEKQQSPLLLSDITQSQAKEAEFTQKEKLTREISEDSEKKPAVDASVKRKRKLSEKGAGNNNNQGPIRKNFKPGGRQGRAGEKKKITLPTKFLLGGNITDPLNLNSLCDDEIGKALNEKTPQSSPLPVPAHKQQVQVLIPPNINDPLNLNSGEDIDISLISPKLINKKKKHKYKKRKSIGEIGDTGQKEVQKEGTDVEATEDNEIVGAAAESTLEREEIKDISNILEKVIDKIVSPAVPQTLQNPKRPTSRRTTSGSESNKGDVGSKSNRSSVCEEVEPKVSAKPEKGFPPKPKPKRQTSPTEPKKSNKKYIYGNYTRYYGYRNSDAEDQRLAYIQKEWIKGKEVLDIGCNIGHVTLTLARDFAPKRIVGMDIDGNLISIAKKNIRHYLSEMKVDMSKFPASLPMKFGPIAVPQMPDQSEMSTFPNNVMFSQGSYVPDTDEHVEMQKEEYDVILALSISKWLHLNWGDAGLKRAFKRMYRQLRPGGKLILEPQSWSSYKKKKKLTESIFKNFQQIRFRPDHFTTYLLSREVGFSECQTIETPYHKAKGFQRPILVYTKPATASDTPLGGADSRGVTPLMDIACSTTPLSNAASCSTPFKDWASSRGATPKFEVGSTGITPCSTCPNTPTYLYNTWSGGGTPRNEVETLGSCCRVEGEIRSRGVTPLHDSCSDVKEERPAVARENLHVAVDSDSNSPLNKDT